MADDGDEEFSSADENDFTGGRQRRAATGRTTIERKSATDSETERHCQCLNGQPAVRLVQ